MPTNCFGRKACFFRDAETWLRFSLIEESPREGVLADIRYPKQDGVACKPKWYSCTVELAKDFHLAVTHQAARVLAGSVADDIPNTGASGTLEAQSCRALYGHFTADLRSQSGNYCRSPALLTDAQSQGTKVASTVARDWQKEEISRLSR
ncbi:hypothetical protein ACVIRO_006088 [Rhizobium ruizarguesonis]